MSLELFLLTIMTSQMSNLTINQILSLNSHQWLKINLIFLNILFVPKLRVFVEWVCFFRHQTHQHSAHKRCQNLPMSLCQKHLVHPDEVDKHGCQPENPPTSSSSDLRVDQSLYYSITETFHSKPSVVLPVDTRPWRQLRVGASLNISIFGLSTTSFSDLFKAFMLESVS